MSTFHVDNRAHIVRTTFDDGTWTGGGIVLEDYEHAVALRVAPFVHRVAHERAHTLVAHLYGEPECPILWAAAHQQPMPDQALLREWYVAAFTYAALGRAQRHVDDWGALMDLQRLAGPERMNEMMTDLRRVIDLSRPQTVSAAS